MEKSDTQLKILMTAAAVLVSLASAPAFAQTVRTPPPTGP